jgi:hypothetical protein
MFLRSEKYPFGRDMTHAQVRRLSMALYTLYPVGCALQLLPEASPWATGAAIAGLLMVAVALMIFAWLAGSGLQRIAQEPESALDERELQLRNRAAYQAFSVFAGIVLIGLMYLMLRQDLADSTRWAAAAQTLWAPSTGAHWNAVFWGLLLLALTLPAAILSFNRDDPADRA